MGGYYPRSKYQVKPTDDVKTNEERFTQVDVYKVAIISMLAYIIAKLNRLV